MEATTGLPALTLGNRDKPFLHFCVWMNYEEWQGVQ
jgi:hypothetical protein